MICLDERASASLCRLSTPRFPTIISLFFRFHGRVWVQTHEYLFHPGEEVPRINPKSRQAPLPKYARLPQIHYSIHYIQRLERGQIASLLLNRSGQNAPSNSQAFLPSSFCYSPAVSMWAQRSGFLVFLCYALLCTLLRNRGWRSLVPSYPNRYRVHNHELVLFRHGLVLGTGFLPVGTFLAGDMLTLDFFLPGVSDSPETSHQLAGTTTKGCFRFTSVYFLKLYFRFLTLITY